MIRLFKHYVPHAVLFLGLIDFCLLLVAAEFSWIVRAGQIGMELEHVMTRADSLLTFAVALEVTAIAVGVYSPPALQSFKFAFARWLVAISLGIIVLAMLAFLFPEITLWRSISLYSMGFALLLLGVTRALLGSLIGGEAFKRRMIVLGAGKRAARIHALEEEKGAAFTVVSYIVMNDGEQAVEEAIGRGAIKNLAKFVVRMSATEVVLALEERRNALPLDDLLRIKTTGVHVNDLSSFLERETGRVDLDSVNPSWLIFSDGFSSGQRLSSFAKRVFDLAASLLLLLLTGPIILLFALIVKLESKGPAFYRQTRVGLFGQDFQILKLRSMRADAEAGGKAIWASENDPRITRVGRVIRKVRIDELPQAWSVLKGEMSFVGPRPERPEFVSDLEKEMPYYAERHMVKPGITGWAQVNYPYGASIADSRVKLEYDLYYAKNYTPFLDMLILLQTLRVVLWPEGAR